MTRGAGVTGVCADAILASSYIYYTYRREVETNNSRLVHGCESHGKKQAKIITVNIASNL
jgi:hypothetical protein